MSGIEEFWWIKRDGGHDPEPALIVFDNTSGGHKPCSAILIGDEYERTLDGITLICRMEAAVSSEESAGANE